MKTCMQHRPTWQSFFIGWNGDRPCTRAAVFRERMGMAGSENDVGGQEWFFCEPCAQRRLLAFGTGLSVTYTRIA